MEIIQSMFSNHHDGIKIEISNRKSIEKSLKHMKTEEDTSK